ncbi:hypothetical protein QO004_000609 [Rhizobium mesoamericanum]|nr:hypothetical protein [Rhizobium mesoamericanum]
MFILALTYVKPKEEADKHMEPHMAWVREGYAKGWFSSWPPDARCHAPAVWSSRSDSGPK